MPQLVARQVKEKFGGLRFYVQAGSDVQRGMITLAEAMSYRICDLCGGRAELRGPDARPDTLRSACGCPATIERRRRARKVLSLQLIAVGRPPRASLVQARYLRPFERSVGHETGVRQHKRLDRLARGGRVDFAIRAHPDECDGCVRAGRPAT